jgi:hypothetical protein
LPPTSLMTWTVSPCLRRTAASARRVGRTCAGYGRSINV